MQFGGGPGETALGGYAQKHTQFSEFHATFPIRAARQDDKQS
jgi:hypothetical protein